MALPPKGDPERSLWLAARSMRLLGIGLIAVGALALLLIIHSLRPGWGMPADSIFWLWVGIANSLTPGVFYLLAATYLKRQQVWAATVGLVLASLHLLVSGFLLVVTISIATTEGNDPAFLIPAVPMLIFVAVLPLLIYRLSRSYRSIWEATLGRQRGFEPVMTHSNEKPGVNHAGLNGDERRH